jgi:spore maturation protein SpmB
MAAIWEFIIANKVVILGALLALSEVLALVPSFKSSGILDWVIKTCKKLLGKE